MIVSIGDRMFDLSDGSLSDRPVNGIYSAEKFLDTVEMACRRFDKVLVKKVRE